MSLCTPIGVIVVSVSYAEISVWSRGAFCLLQKVCRSSDGINHIT